jgi:hypothetical protein
MCRVHGYYQHGKKLVGLIMENFFRLLLDKDFHPVGIFVVSTIILFAIALFNVGMYNTHGSEIIPGLKDILSSGWALLISSWFISVVVMRLLLYIKSKNQYYRAMTDELKTTLVLSWLPIINFCGLVGLVVIWAGLSVVGGVSKLLELESKLFK